MALLPFVLGSMVGRGGRFLLVAGAIRLGGERLERILLRYIEWVGWGVVVVLAGLLIWLEGRA
jgi:hypothetical protein